MLSPCLPDPCAQKVGGGDMGASSSTPAPGAGGVCLSSFEFLLLFWTRSVLPVPASDHYLKQFHLQLSCCQDAHAFISANQSNLGSHAE